MNASTIPSRDELVAVLTDNGISPDDAELVADAIPEEGRAQTIANYAVAREERKAVRARLCADPELMRAVCPKASWKDEDARYDTARRALQLVDAFAEHHNTDAHSLALALIQGEGTVADTIELHGDDPRIVQWGQSFYAFRWRLKDAVAVACSERLARERREREEARDAAWAARGLTRCDRCGGAGGAAHWPGWTCFDCNGHGAKS